MGLRDRISDAIGGAIGSGIDLMADSLDKANNRPRSDEPSERGGSSMAMTAAQGRSPLPPDPPPEDPKALLYDPFALIDQLGYRDRPTGLTYGTLREMSRRVPTYTAIVQTRINQISSFGQRQKDPRDPGFGVVLRDSKATPTKQDKIRARQLEDMVLQTGVQWAPGRDDFRTFLRKLTRDALDLDQACHPAGTMVELADGVQRPIEALAIGDVVRTHKGRTRPVVECMGRPYSGALHTLRSGGLELTATAGHPLLVVDDPDLRFRKQKPKPDWRPIEDIREGHYLVYPKPVSGTETLPVFSIFPSEGRRQYTTVPYSEIAEMAGVHERTARQILCGSYSKNGLAVSRVKAVAANLGWARKSTTRPEQVKFDSRFAFLCGAYVAEGSLSRSGVQFALGSEGTEFLAEGIRSALDAIGVSFCENPYKGRNAFCITASSVDLVSFMRSQFGSGAAQKRLPAWIFDAPEESRRSFLAAYLLGDGAFKGSGISFSTVSRDLFGGLRQLLAGFGIYAREIVSPEVEWAGSYGYRHNRELYSANLSGKRLRELLRASGGFEVIEPKRVREPYLQDEEFFYLPVREVSVSQVEDFPVFNIEVADDHSYIANGIVSHNCFEIQRNRKGHPAAFYALDGGTMRLADVPPGAEATQDPNQVKYVQVYDEVIISEFAAHEVSFGVRNPRTDIRVNGYGISELELLINVITATLWAFEYNRRVFSQGSLVNGIINMKGSVGDSKLDSFRRQWKMMIAGVSNAHRVPFTNVDELQWIDFQKSNRDMEYGEWMDFLIKITCAVLQFDPAEINFTYGNSGQSQGSMFSSPVDQKLKASKDRGLRPLLKDIATWLNVHVVWPLDPYMEFAFLGIDAKSADQAVDLSKKEAEFKKTVDEIRAEDDLPPLPDGAGEVILNPVWLQAKQAADAMAQQEEMGDEGDDEDSPMGDVMGMPGSSDGGDEGPSPVDDDDFSELFPEKSERQNSTLRKSGRRRAKVRVYDIEL